MSQGEIRELQKMAALLKRIEFLSHSWEMDKKEPISFYQGVAMLLAEPLLSAQSTQHPN